jgi:transcriptional regulator with XRE-family HTH domain
VTPARILRLRLSLGLTQYALAAKIGFGGKQRHMNVYRWEAGLRTPSAPAMKMLEGMARRATDGR